MFTPPPPSILHLTPLQHISLLQTLFLQLFFPFWPTLILQGFFFLSFLVLCSLSLLFFLLLCLFYPIPNFVFSICLSFLPLVYTSPLLFLAPLFQFQFLLYIFLFCFLSASPFVLCSHLLIYFKPFFLCLDILFYPLLLSFLSFSLSLFHFFFLSTYTSHSFSDPNPFFLLRLLLFFLSFLLLSFLSLSLSLSPSSISSFSLLIPPIPFLIQTLSFSWDCFFFFILSATFFSLYLLFPLFSFLNFLSDPFTFFLCLGRFFLIFCFFLYPSSLTLSISFWSDPTPFLLSQLPFFCFFLLSLSLSLLPLHLCITYLSNFPLNPLFIPSHLSTCQFLTSSFIFLWLPSSSFFFCLPATVTAIRIVFCLNRQLSMASMGQHFWERERGRDPSFRIDCRSNCWSACNSLAIDLLITLMLSNVVVVDNTFHFLLPMTAYHCRHHYHCHHEFLGILSEECD